MLVQIIVLPLVAYCVFKASCRSNTKPVGGEKNGFKEEINRLIDP